jgi:radical SAM superfamily enzyme YgiQ (UPF0313 family)
MRPKLAIIAPTNTNTKQGFWRGGKVLAPPLALPLLAGRTPIDIDVRLIDENVEPIIDPYTIEADGVAITCPTASALRAYYLADIFRGRNIPVVMGGIHPTVMPEEAAKHADAVVICESEPVWPKVLADMAAGRLQQYYRHEGFVPLGGYPFPRRDLLRSECYLTINNIQTSRGCPNCCSFCSVSTVCGKELRFRPIDEVIEEIRSLGKGWLGIVDDNITGDPYRAKMFLEALIFMKRKWIGQADLNIAKDPELLRLLALSGCQALFIGLESISQENLRTTGKTPNKGVDMAAAIAAIHRAGIDIVGSFILGLDGDDSSSFAKTVDFAEENGLAAAQFSVLTPYPGTPLRRQFEKTDRITDQDWSHYTMSTVVFKPLKMTAEKLKEGQAYAQRRFYSWGSIAKRNFRRRKRLGFRLLANVSYRMITREKGGISRFLPS